MRRLDWPKTVRQQKHRPTALAGWGDGFTVINVKRSGTRLLSQNVTWFYFRPADAQARGLCGVSGSVFSQRVSSCVSNQGLSFSAF